MNKWNEVLALSLLRRAPSHCLQPAQVDEAQEGGREAHLAASPGQPPLEEALADAIKGAWLGVEALLAERSLPGGGGARGATGALTHAARRVGTNGSGEPLSEERVQACRAALAAARQAGLLGPSEPIDLSGLLPLAFGAAEGAAPFDDRADGEDVFAGSLRDLELLGYPGIELVSHLYWGDALLLHALADALLARALGGQPGESVPGGRGLSDGGALLAEVVEVLADARDEVWPLLAFGPVPPDGANGRGDRRDGEGGPEADEGDLPPVSQPAADDYLERAADRAERGDRQGALRDCARAIELVPTSALAFEARGDVSARFGPIEEAIADYSRAAALAPSRPSVFLKRGDAHRSEAQLDRAAADYSEALRLWPECLVALIRRAGVLRQLGRFDEALHDLTEALALDPDNSEAYLERGMTLLDTKGARAPLDDFHRAIDLVPDNPDAYYQRARAREAAGDTDGARADYDAALARAPGHAQSLLGRGRVRVRAGDLTGGISDLTAAVESSEAPTVALLERAPALARMGRLDKAMEDCDAVLQREPHRAAVYLMRGQFATEQGAYEEAQADFTRALEIDPGLAQAYEARGACALRRGDQTQALADFSQALSRDPRNARAFVLRGTLHGRAGRYLEALSDLHQAALLDPSQASAYYGQRAQLHLARGEYHLALADSVIELRLDPSNVEALARQEQAREGLRRQEEAGGVAALLLPDGLGAGLPEAPQRRATSLLAPARGQGGGTQVVRQRRAPETQIAMPALDAPDRSAPGDETATFPEAPAPGASARHVVPPEGGAIDRAWPAPSAPGPTAPDQPVPAPEPTADAPSSPAVPAGPMHARSLRDSRWEEVKERARQWEELHAPTPPGAWGPPRAAPPPLRPRAEERAPWGPRLARLGVILLMLAVVGGLGYLAYLFSGDPEVTAAEVWNEFHQDPGAADSRYRDQFVLVTGTIRLRSDRRSLRLFFEPPAEKPTWWIEVPLTPAQAKGVADKSTITVRGRFNPRKGPKDNVVMSNCHLIKVHPGG